MTIEQRIEALEKRCKRLGKTLVGVGTLALFAVVAGTAGWTVAYTGAISPSKITTKTIHLKDHNGKVRLSLFGSNGSIYLKDSAGRKRLELYGQNGTFHARDKAGRGRIHLRGKDGIIRAYDSAGKVRLTLHGGSGSLSMKDKAGKMRILLYGPAGKISFTAPNGTTINHP